MNREIKFRAWDKEEKIMYEVDVMCPPWAECWQHEVEQEVPSGKKKYSGIYAEDCDTELMQYTGLSDKNGKEIYEGDIICSTNRESTIYTVEFNEASFVGKRKKSPNHHQDWGLWVYLDVLCSDSNNIDGKRKSDIEIIGNIYENPELLK